MLPSMQRRAGRGSDGKQGAALLGFFGSCIAFLILSLQGTVALRRACPARPPPSTFFLGLCVWPRPVSAPQTASSSW